MNAWVLHGVNDIRLETVRNPLPDRGEVLVAVKAAGICGSDIPRIYKTGAHCHPLIPGHELSGIVEAVGADVPGIWEGQHVGIFPLIPCGTCEFCSENRYELCRNYDYIGSRRNGGFAEYVAVPVWNLMKLPASVSFEEAAMLEPMAVAVHAMRRAAILDSETVVVCGLGAIGLLLLLFLLEAGKPQPPGKIFVIGNKESQRQRVIKLGLPEECYCDGKEQPIGKWLMEHTNGRGVDVFFECVGKNETIAEGIQNMAPLGRVVLVGNPYFDISLGKSVYWKILRNQLTVTGTWNSSFTHNQEDDWHYALDRLSKNRIVPADMISHRLPLEKMEQGLEIMRDKTQDYVKILGVPDGM